MLKQAKLRFFDKLKKIIRIFFFSFICRIDFDLYFKYSYLYNKFVILYKIKIIYKKLFILKVIYEIWYIFLSKIYFKCFYWLVEMMEKFKLFVFEMFFFLFFEISYW